MAGSGVEAAGASPADGGRARALPAWAEEIREIFRAGTLSQFVLHGNVFDVVPDTHGPMRFLSLRDYLVEVLFAPFDCVVYYNRGAGVRALKGKELFDTFLKMLDDWTQSSFTAALPREPAEALDLCDRFLHYSARRPVVENGTTRVAPLKSAIIIDFAQFIVPQADGACADILIRLLEWASDPNLLGAQSMTVLIAENLADLSRTLTDHPYVAKVRIPLPTEDDSIQHVRWLAQQYPELTERCTVPIDEIGRRLVGLSRVNQRHLIAQAVHNNRPITDAYLAKLKKELIEKACAGLLEFIESRASLSDVAGHEAVRAWLRDDARLMREGRSSALPMGYLMTGRIGTGKTWLANCWAGEVGVPFVALKNFRDKWMGATEGNLEKIFNVLHALGQVIVFIDEADQMTGKRGGSDTDGGLGGRIYGMIAQQMSETRNRGRIVWIFATSRPDLVELDLKRPGRLDVHIPLFPPQSDDERQALFHAMASKVGLPLGPQDLPPLPPGVDIGGNEMEALMVRAMRVHALGSGQEPLVEVLSRVLSEYRPLAHRRHLEFMDLIAVKECTDAQFLPAAYRELRPEEVDDRIETLKRELRLG